MSKYKIHQESGETKTFDDKEKFEDICQLLDEDGREYTTETPDTKSDGGTEIVEHAEGDTTETVETQAEPIPEPSNLTSDPLDVISKNANQFTDDIKGKTVINRQGYAVLAERFDISVVADPVTLPSEADNDYAEFRAIATTDDGKEYSGFGSASVDRGDDSTLLAELAETRAMKRATAWATGVGMTAVSELENEL